MVKITQITMTEPLWVLNQSFLQHALFCPQAPQALNTWCMRQLVYLENCMGKSQIVKKNCVDNYLI